MQQGMTRRRLLQAGATAGLAALAADPLIKSALASMPVSGKLSDIEHVVILIQENRSFDHYFGTLRGRARVRRPGAESVSPSPAIRRQATKGTCCPSTWTPGRAQCFPDITHNWAPAARMLGQRRDGRASSKPTSPSDGDAAGPATMGYYEQADIPFYYALAERVHALRRLLLLGARADRPEPPLQRRGHDRPRRRSTAARCVETLISPEREELDGASRGTTMPEQLSAAGISWKVYNGTAAGGIARQRAHVLQKLPDQPDAAANERSRRLPERLPSATSPPANCRRSRGSTRRSPRPSTRATPRRRSASTSSASWSKRSRATRKSWEKTALFVTWDENGGFFDHVAPPVAPRRHARASTSRRPT